MTQRMGDDQRKGCAQGCSFSPLIATTRVLQDIGRAAAAHDSGTAEHASERLKNDYFELIAALTR